MNALIYAVEERLEQRKGLSSKLRGLFGQKLYYRFV